MTNFSASDVPHDAAMSDGTQKKIITIAVTGNPNAGKTTIFNHLTGANQKVGNYGGVTVDTKEGYMNYGPQRLRVVDLPGTYSLTAYSAEEIVARNFILKEHPDVVLNIVDGSNLERNLYLAVQFKELNVPMVLAINMADEMRKKGFSVKKEILERELGCPVVFTVGVRKKGIRTLIARLIEVANGTWEKAASPQLPYGREIEEEIEKIVHLLKVTGATSSATGKTSASDAADTLNASDAANTYNVSYPVGTSSASSPAGELNISDTSGISGQKPELSGLKNPHWVAIKLLENDLDIREKLLEEPARQRIAEQVEYSRKRLLDLFGEDPEILIAERRYGYISGIVRVAVRHTAETRMYLSDNIDKILTNRLLGLPIFGVLMYFTFYLVFTLGQYPMDWIDIGFQHFSVFLMQHWPAILPEAIRSLVIDGIIGGVGGVLVFVPNIVLLFLAITLLEDTGYMARAAFIMDRLMKWVGLHGKSFIPMLTGFGCSVPAIMGTRILDNRRDRFTTLLVLPLMSCGARLPIYMLIIPAFFPESQRANIMYSLYLIGIVLAIISAKILRSTLFKGAPSPFVMELPPYRIPTLKAVFIHVWFRTRLYIRKAGTVILAFSIIMWAMASYPRVPASRLAGLTPAQAQEAQLSYSFSGRLGKVLEPVIRPLGFDWKIGTALVGAFPAKELFVSQLSIVYSLGEVDTESAEHAQTLRAILRRHYSPLVGFCIMLFCLVSAPCMATVAVTRRETGSWAWALGQFFGLTLLAYIITLIVYQVGSLVTG